MACKRGKSGVIDELRALVNQIGNCGGGDKKDGVNGCCPSDPCALPTVTFPFAQVTMMCPPPILAPTYPQPVQPLQMPCPGPANMGSPPLTRDQEERFRYNNYYNNYNVDWHPDCCKPCPVQPNYRKDKENCVDYTKKNKDDCRSPGCPTGFKPCEMKLTPPPCCDPNGVWLAQVQPCPPKPKKKVSNFYVPGPCTRPCCKHWKPKEPPCVYDDPCKAHCYNHPFGMKPSGRFP